MKFMNHDNEDKFDRACNLVMFEAFGLPPEIKLANSFSFTGGNRYKINLPEPGPMTVVLPGDEEPIFNILDDLRLDRPVKSPNLVKVPKVTLNKIKQAVRRTMIKRQILNRLLMEAQVDQKQIEYVSNLTNEELIEQSEPITEEFVRGIDLDSDGCQS